MHLLMIVSMLVVAWGLRLRSQPTGTWSDRWHRALALFLLPPLLLLMTAIAVICMGPQGRMVWWWEGWFSYTLAIAFVGIAAVLCLRLAWQGQQTLRQVRQHPLIDLNGNPARLLDTAELYSAQVGFWQPELVVSQGLLDQLPPPHLDAVLTHEQSHAAYRDTFWFFWLGWVRRLTLWLPQTEALWQELLMLRELRADRRAAQQVDPLLLAESLLLVVRAPLMQPEVCAAFSYSVGRDRLNERIDALLAAPEPIEPVPLRFWIWLPWMFLPLITIPFHS